MLLRVSPWINWFCLAQHSSEKNCLTSKLIQLLFLRYAPNTPAKTTNCRICQHFTAPHAQNASRAAARRQRNRPQQSRYKPRYHPCSASRTCRFRCPYPKNRLSPDRIAFTLGWCLDTKPPKEKRRQKERAPPTDAPTQPSPSLNTIATERECFRHSMKGAQSPCLHGERKPHDASYTHPA